MKAFLLALQFLTCLPLTLRSAPRPADWGRSALAYPLVGLLIGLLLAGLQRLIGHADPMLQAALLTTAWALVTGGLHLDGLADTADAWVGGHGDRARSLEIMKDPRSGPAAVSALVLVLLLKFAALAVLAKGDAWPALLAAPLLGRGVLLAMLAFTPYVRAGGLGAAMAEHVPRPFALLMVAATAISAVFLPGGWQALLAVVAVALLLRRAFLIRLEGITGDTLGASLELAETAALVAMALHL